jgi:hypothetical protein
MALKLTYIIDILYIIWFIIRVNNLTGVKVFPSSPSRRKLKTDFKLEVNVKKWGRGRCWCCFFCLKCLEVHVYKYPTEMALKLTYIIDILYIIWFIIRVNNLTGVKVFPLSPRQLPDTFRYIDNVSVSNNPVENWFQIRGKCQEMGQRTMLMLFLLSQVLGGTCMSCIHFVVQSILQY